MSEAKERPILMSAESVRAILAGRKTMTRRPIVSVLGIGRVTEFGASDTKGYDFAMRDRQMRWNELRRDDLLARCPYPIGSRLWVRETWRPVYLTPRPRTEELSVVQYAADGAFNRDDWGGVVLGESWHPSIFLPRRFSRILLEVTGNGAERLWDITPADAIAEGVETLPWYTGDAVAAYLEWRRRINGKRYPVESNPWDWPITFKVLEAAGARS